MATATDALNNQAATVSAAIQDVKNNVREFIGKSHPAALIAWFLVGVFLLAGLIFTGYHNWNLFARGAGTDAGRTLAIVPPFLLDGSIALLLVLLLTYFKDGLQWWLAVLFNALLFVIVGINTSLDYSLSNHEILGDGLRAYLRFGLLFSFLLTFILWEILIHVDPKHRQRMKRARLEMKAAEDAAEIELDLIELSIQAQKNDLEYRKERVKRKHNARMAALKREEVEAAWDDYETGEAESEAETIRSEAPKPTSPKAPRRP